MKTITLRRKWTYRTPEITIAFPAGVHEVADEVAAAVPVHKEKQHARRTAANRSPRVADAAEE